MQKIFPKLQTTFQNEGRSNEKIVIIFLKNIFLPYPSLLLIGISNQVALFIGIP